MSQTQAINEEVRSHSAGRLFAFLYGFVSYSVFVVTLLYAIGFVSGLVVDKTVDTGAAAPIPEAFVVNLLLLSVFAVQHSVMARRQFKRLWTQFVPKSVERSTYVLFSSLALILLFWQWRPIPVDIWHIENPQFAMAVTALSFAGFLFALSSTFLINHFELFGLHQVTNNFVGQPMPAPRFRTPLYYRFVRHPLYLGFIIAFWAAPTMTAGHLLFAAVTTGYIMVGILLEERDLIHLFGDDYRRYKERVAMLVPWRKSA
jgi:protein-S-isoprenylcysteine O-methyltransferase Ste14